MEDQCFVIVVVYPDLNQIQTSSNTLLTVIYIIYDFFVLTQKMSN